MKHKVLKRCGRYALLEREHNDIKFIVACGYNAESGEWNQGYYFCGYQAALAEFRDLSGSACALCAHVNDGCIVCKR